MLIPPVLPCLQNLLNATARFVGDPYEPLVFIDEHRRADLEFIEVKVDFEPLLLSTMRRFSSVIVSVQLWIH